ncbi:MAG: Ig-like domain-containing protein [Desulfuromusa sp.]|nr:Ig-like domain-containing protein [Desulfuromusa sp.]
MMTKQQTKGIHLLPELPVSQLKISTGLSQSLFNMLRISVSQSGIGQIIDKSLDGINYMIMSVKGILKQTFVILFFSSVFIITACGSSDDPKDPVNEDPVATSDTFSVNNASTTQLNLAINDSDADGTLDLTSIAIITAASNGSLQINSDGTVSYTHNGTATLSDSFTYTIQDNNAATSNTATVSITISPATVNVQAGIYDTTVVEGADNLEFAITLLSASSKAVSLDYTTENGTAIAGTDFLATSGTLQFTPGTLRQFVTVSVLNNPATSTTSSRSMQLVLSNPQFAEIVDTFAIGTIVDKDSMSINTTYDHNWSPIGAFTNAAKCGTDCHKASDPTLTFNNKDISPGTQWRHSVMANAFVDPYWQAAVEDEVDTFPHLAGFIEDTCTRCHAPMGRTDAYHTNTNLDVDGFFRFNTAKDQMHSREGVSCTVCHQIDVNASSISGGFNIPGDQSADYKNINGPYNNPVGNNMFAQTGYTPIANNLISSSELCATCHTLYTPSLDPDTGSPNGINFLEQGPHLEWQNSVYASGQSQEAQCQDCHMPEPTAVYTTPISLMPPWAPDRSPYSQHTLVGGNTHLLEILRDYRSELGIKLATTVSGFDEQIALTQEFLNTATTLSISPLVTNSNNLDFNIAVTNNAGHKMPSAYPSRRMWLHVTVTDNNSNIIFESGKPDSRGYLSTDETRLKADCMSAHKLEGFDSSLCYEPHRDVINDPSQIAIYETVLGDSQNNITHTLLQGASYLKDNRIPPLGFTNAKAATIEPQTIPAGVTGDNDFNCLNSNEGCGTDTVHYQVNIANQAGPFTVTTRLLYQATQPAFVDGMHNSGDRVNRFKVMYDAVPPSVEILAEATKS